MLRSIRGPVVASSPQSVTIEVAGLGLEVYTTPHEQFAPGQEALLHTYLAVKQDGLELYGFSDVADRSFFELMLTIPGVGPKTALGILRRAPRAALEGAISARDVAYLTKVAGLGKKSAEKMVIELAEKVSDTTHDDTDSEVFETLIALGYAEREARQAVQRIPETVKGKDERLRAALGSNAAS